MARLGFRMVGEAAEARALVDRAAGGDPDAWEELHRRAYPHLFGYCRRRLFGDAAAEDAVAETMTRAMRAIGRFSWDGAGFDAWLLGIARNVVLETTRIRERAAVIDLDSRAPTAGDPEAVRVRQAFELLSSSDREVLELRVVGGLTAEEVGAILDRAPGAVRMAQTRALQRLRAILGEEVEA